MKLLISAILLAFAGYFIFSSMHLIPFAFGTPVDPVAKAQLAQNMVYSIACSIGSQIVRKSKA